MNQSPQTVEQHQSILNSQATPNSDQSEDAVSGIYQGSVTHSRLGKKKHQFTYRISLLGTDIDDISRLSSTSRILGQRWFNPVRFKQTDYLRDDLFSTSGEPLNLRQRIESKVAELGGHWDSGRIFMLCQCRCLGLYFSPINFYYCYNQQGDCQYMLAEVSNTPWNQLHYYLVPMSSSTTKVNRPITPKAFHVSPFMDLAMQYRWYLPAPTTHIKVGIDNINQAGETIFSVTMGLAKQSLTTAKLLTSWLTLPLSVIKTMTLIYWQALQLFIKQIPFVTYQKSQSQQHSSDNKLEP